MFFLEKKVLAEVPGRRKPNGEPIYAYRWEPRYYCIVDWPLRHFLEHLDPQEYRIVFRKGGATK